jgi:hypothetical protein
VRRRLRELHASQHSQQQYAAVTSSSMKTPRTKHGDALAPGFNEVRESHMLKIPHKHRRANNGAEQ